MGKKTTLSITAVIIGLVYLPISLYYQWLILDRIQGTDLLYFLFWLSIPISIIVIILSRTAELMGKDD